jgi:hypothetical protein
MNPKNLDHLERLNIGPVPVEATFPDWACMEGYVLYLFFGKSGECRYVRVPLDESLIATIHAASYSGGFSLYRDSRGRLTAVGRFIGLFCLEQAIPAAAICRELGVSERDLDRLKRERHTCAASPREASAFPNLLAIALKGEIKA